ncbi:MAG: geranylgeranylglyceryl/heptaprenylglyceryl phosphate synthase [Salinivirgaceae bacterium]|nr:MAG: geranylgeranylglyceryl/heptaprenylglyceryl phosphate synthase [Salinivirgaceae bacterium]
MHIGSLNKKSRKLALLVDPDSVQMKQIENLFTIPGANLVDYFLVGGSLLMSEFESAILELKKQTDKPVIIFPGNAFQISEYADAFMLLSLISGRNPEFLIGHHVMAAPQLKRIGITVVSTGYILIDGGQPSSVQYMSNSMPIPAAKNDIAVATAQAGEMIGMKQLYLEAGSGASHPVPTSLISKVVQSVDLPIIVGGGIRTPEQAENAWKAGANLVVVGNAIEKDPEFISELITARAALG